MGEIVEAWASRMDDGVSCERFERLVLTEVNISRDMVETEFKLASLIVLFAGAVALSL